MLEDYIETDADELFKTFEEEQKLEKELREFDSNLNGAEKRYLFKTLVVLQEHLKQIEKDIKLCNDLLDASKELLAWENKAQKYQETKSVLLGAIGGNVATFVALCAEKAMNQNFDLPVLLGQQGGMVAGGAMIGYLYYKAFKQRKYEQEKQNNMECIQRGQARVSAHKNLLKRDAFVSSKKCNILQKHIEAANTKDMINKEGIFKVATAASDRKI